MTSGDVALARASAELGEVIDAAAFDPERWRDFIEQVGKFIPGTKIVLQVIDRETNLPLSFLSAGWNQKTLDAYQQYYWKINPWPEAWNNMTMSAVESSLPYYSHDRLRKTEFFTDLLNPEQEADGATGLKFAAHRDRFAIVAVHSDIKQEQRVETAAQTLLQRLVPRLRAALETNRVMAGRQSPSTSPDLLETLLDAALLVDEDCRLLAANPAAQALLSAKAGIRVGANDLVQFARPAANKAFATLVRKTCELTRRPHDLARLDDLLVDLQTGRYTVAALPVARSQAALAALGLITLYRGNASALIVLRPRPQGLAHDPLELLRRIHGLTPAEARLALALDGGGRLPEVALRIGISYETARSQLKAIFTKTGTHNQRDLIALILRATNN